MDFIGSLPKVKNNKARFISEQICDELRTHVMRNPESKEWGIVDDYSDTIKTRRDENGEILTDDEYDRFYVALKKRSSRLQIEADRRHGEGMYEYRLRGGIVYGRYIGPRPTNNTPRDKAARRVDPTTTTPTSVGASNVVELSARRPAPVATRQPAGDETVDDTETVDDEAVHSRSSSPSRRPPGW